MSELKKELLEPAITKKRIIGVIILAGVLIFAFIYSVYAMSLIFGTQRIEPSDELDKAKYEDAEELEPNFPFDLDALLDWLEDNFDPEEFDPSEFDIDDLEDLGIDISDLNIDDLAALADLINSEDVYDFLEEMLDGNIDDYDLTMAGLAIAALLFSEVPAFRVFEYDDPIEDREDILWKYECFDQFNGDGWQSTVPMEISDFFPTSDEYDSYYQLLGYDQIKIKIPLNAQEGSNSFIIGSLFPTPYIIEDSFQAPNLDQTILSKDEFDCVSANLFFDTDGGINVTFDLFGADIPSNDDINATAVSANYNPTDPDFQKFLQLPGGVNSYINVNPFFLNDWNNLDAIINSNDNAFMVANKIRNYLQSNFALSFNALVNDPIGDGEDIVYWFCEHDEGLYSEFASAFCAFTRSFGVASRFVDGFNSRLIEEYFDSEENQLGYPIKYKNIYNWAEVYVPRDTLGNGEWVQMDLLYDSYGEGGAPIEILDYDINVFSNFSKSQTYKRGQLVNITAILSSDTESVNQKTITFTDITSGYELNTSVTNNLGKASIIFNTSDKHIVGPNVIEASYQNVDNYTYYVIDGDVFVNLTSLNPQEVNVSESPHTTTARGYIEDVTTSQRIENSLITFLLFNDGTSTPVPALPPFDPEFVYTDSNGEFDIDLTINDNINFGEYDFRVDFNGSWLIPIDPYLINRPNINASSNIIDFNVTEEFTYNLFFYIKNRPTEYNNKPLDPATLINVKRNEDLRLSVIVEDEITHNPISGIGVTFYDYTNNILIGSNFTNSKGNSSIIYAIGDNHKSGPTLVYIELGSNTNYSYFIVNESIDLKINSGPSPCEIELSPTDSQPFNISGAVTDSKSNDIGFAKIKLNLFNEYGQNYTHNLVPYQNYPYITGNDGVFNLDFEVEPDTPFGNYTLRIDFNGSFILTNDLNNPWAYDFAGGNSLNYLSNSSVFVKQLKIIDPYNISIFLEVDGDPAASPRNYDEAYKPRSYIRGIGQITFEIWINQSGTAVESGYVTILDVYSNDNLSKYTFTGLETPKGYVQINIPTSRFYYAGIHKIEVQYMNYPTINTTYIIINETVNFDVNPVINVDNEITRDIESFIVSGYIRENGTALNGLTLRIVLLNQNNVNYTSFLIGTKTCTTNENGYFRFNINFVNQSCLQGLYFIRIDFNGSIYISDSPGIDPIANFMVENSSLPVPLNITADTYFFNYNYYKDFNYPGWWENDTCHIVGYLRWDNDTGIVGVRVNATVKNSTLQIIALNSSLTIAQGYFEITFTIKKDWIGPTIYISFYHPVETIGSPEAYYIEEIIEIQVPEQP